MVDTSEHKFERGVAVLYVQESGLRMRAMLPKIQLLSTALDQTIYNDQSERNVFLTFNDIATSSQITHT